MPMIKLRDLSLDDLEEYKRWKMPLHKYHEFNGPYFPRKTEEEIDLEIVYLKSLISTGQIELNRKLISDSTNKIIGEVSWYWKSEETQWMEIGIVIFDESYWGKGIGYIAMEEWISQLFNRNKEIVRLGLTTWSGNHGMIRLSEKLGLMKEAEYRKARLINGVYFDSVSYGVLREEWTNRNSN